MIKKIIAFLLLFILSAENVCFATVNTADYAKKNSQLLNDYPKRISKLKINSVLAHEWGGVLGSADVKTDMFKGRLELPWIGGNYIVWNTGMGNSSDEHYGAEYNAAKNMVGFIIIKETKVQPSIVLYEYDYSQFDAPLVNVLIYHKDQNKPLFLYSANGDLTASYLDGAVKIYNKNAVKNADFLKTLAVILNNPKKAVK